MGDEAEHHQVPAGSSVAGGLCQAPLKLDALGGNTSSNAAPGWSNRMSMCGADRGGDWGSEGQEQAGRVKLRAHTRNTWRLVDPVGGGGSTGCKGHTRTMQLLLVICIHVTPACTRSNLWPSSRQLLRGQCSLCQCTIGDTPTSKVRDLTDCKQILRQL